MTRSRRPYGEPVAYRPIPLGNALASDTPVAGYYRHRLRSRTVAGAVRIWHGPPMDPVTGEEMDRCWRWQASFNGEYVEIDDVWPVCAREPINEREHDRLIAQRDWAREHAPRSAYAEAGRKVDLLSLDTPLPF